MSQIENIIDQLPNDSTLEKISVIESGAQAANVLFTFPVALHKQAVMVKGEIDNQVGSQFELLTVPSRCLEDEQVLSQLNDWVNPKDADNQSPLVLSLQHVQVFWTPEKIVVFVYEEFSPTVKSAIIEVSYYVSQLVEIENQLATNWPQLEADIPTAFEYDQQAARKKKQLMQRFKETYVLRAQLAKLTPFLLSPHTYPPTLESQISDRLRERIRVEDRVEFVSDSLEVYEEVYELCGQRVNDFQHARKGHTLEWIIIILLGAELVVVAFDYLSSLGT